MHDNIPTADAMDSMELVYEAYIAGARRAAERGLRALDAGDKVNAQHALEDVLTFLSKE